MADLGKWSGNTVSITPTESWAAPNALFPTEDRNDSSVYGFVSSTSVLTLPSSALANGYLIVGFFEFESTGNNRMMPQGRFIQASGTGTFVGGPTGGFQRDNSEDRAYVRCWAFVDNPSASSTYTFQWKRDTDSVSGGTVRSELQVIPLFYANHGIYSSSSAALYGGTTPNVVTGWSADDESDTNAIEIASNVVTLKTDNADYLVLGQQFYEGWGNVRTQRWFGLDVDGSQDDEIKTYVYSRDVDNDENGGFYASIIRRVTTDIDLESTCYRGDGVSNAQGGASADSSAPSVGDHTLVVLELNSTAEVFRSHLNTATGDLSSSPTVIDVNEVTDFNDTASFTDLVDASINCVQTADYLFGANVGIASNNVSNTTRFTGYAEFTVNGTNQTDSADGNYMRNNQGTQDTFGLSANLLGFLGLSAGDDVGVEYTMLAGSEGGGDPISNAGWTGFWGLNLDTLEDSGGNTYDESVQFDADAGFSLVNDIDMDAAADFDAQADYSLDNGIDMDVSAQYDAQAGYSAVGVLDIPASALFDAQADYSALGGLSLSESIQFDAQGDFSLADALTLNESVQFDAQSDYSLDNTVDMPASVSFGGQADYSALGIHNINVSVQFDAEADYSADRGLVLMESIQFDLEADYSLVDGLAIFESIQFDVDAGYSAGNAIDMPASVQFDADAGYSALAVHNIFVQAQFGVDAGFGLTVVHDIFLSADFGVVADYSLTDGLLLEEAIQFDVDAGYSVDDSLTLNEGVSFGVDVDSALDSTQDMSEAIQENVEAGYSLDSEHIIHVSADFGALMDYSAHDHISVEYFDSIQFDLESNFIISPSLDHPIPCDQVYYLENGDTYVMLDENTYAICVMPLPDDYLEDRAGFIDRPYRRKKLERRATNRGVMRSGGGKSVSRSGTRKKL